MTLEEIRIKRPDLICRQTDTYSEILRKCKEIDNEAKRQDRLDR